VKALDHNFLELRDELIFVDAAELFVASRLRSNFHSGDYKVLNNMLLPTKTRLRTTQIDHVVVSIYGIFCIETKSYKGLISASKDRGIFKQVLSNRQYPIVPNPLRQNQAHIRAIENILGKDLKVPVVSLIVFPSADKVNVYGYENIGTIFEMLDCIKSYKNKVYRYDDAKRIIEKLSAYNLADENDHTQHVNMLKKTFART
jgi:hypothetical protein